MNKNVNKAIAMRKRGESVTNKTFPIPITRARSFLTLKSERVTANAGVAFSAFLEYIISEILELAGNVARDEKRVAISPHHISKAIDTDEELARLSKTMNFLVLGN
jgi:histone H3/H4